MIWRLSGMLEGVEANSALVRINEGITLEVLLPAYLARTLITKVGERITLHTMAYLEGQGQGTSFIPRLIGFGSPAERKFFEVFTSVKGIGNRKALRALAEPIGVIAGAVQRNDARALVELPEIGKRMADTIIAELKGKLDAFVTGTVGAAIGNGRGAPASAGRSDLSPAQRDAVEALISLGETRTDAENKVLRAVERTGGKGLETPEKLVAAVFGAR